MQDQSPLTVFHPLVRRWFESSFDSPTAIQRRAWPLIATNHHVLITAPTGSGKTLAAFLWAVDQLIGGQLETGRTRVLYVSPLKALNNDVRRNLMRPLGALRELFAQHGTPLPDIRVATRSGDTPAGDRRKMIRQPPEILITTPESLHLMLSSHGGRSILGQIRTVILDEVHAVAGNKRGTLLMAAIERLVPLCGEFQRIALSATINPVKRVAAFVAGFTMHGDPLDPVYTPRDIACCRDAHRQRDIIRVRIPDEVMAGDTSRDFWQALAGSFRTCIDRHRSTIIFTNSRRLCEKLTFLINAGSAQPVAYAHHGSLSKALRLEVERRLKAGTLKAIVATASLELGIDIGRLDQVILVQAPYSISSAVQRIGRSGHAVGKTRRAVFVATHANDAITAATLARAVTDGMIDPLHPVLCPLDVLAQIIVSMVGVETWHAEDLYHRMRTAYPFHELTRETFNLVVEMLAGRYAGTRLSGLQPKVAFDRLENRLLARKGALLSLYGAGGVIPDRGYFTLRHRESGARIGELDEEFVWEAKKGQVFTLGTQNWRITRITHNDVFVKPARPKAPAPPFWRAEEADHDFFLAERIGGFLEHAGGRLTDPGLIEELCAWHGMDKKGARYLIDFLDRQQERTGCALPHRHHLVVEQMPAQKGGGVGQVVLHTFWGGRVNRPYALALGAAWKKHYGHTPSIFPTNAAVYLLSAQTVAIDDISTLVSPGTVESYLREELEGSGIFGARFRECAGRALLLPRQRFGRRMPLWLSRQQSQRLLDAVGGFTDFPIVLEAWRSCLQDDFDMIALKRVLSELERGEIASSVVRTRAPSPMALAGSWRLINQYMYADDRQQGTVKTRLSGVLLKDVGLRPELRPGVDTAAIDEFVNKRQRLHPGYAPDTAVELLEWVKERLLIPWPEWRSLVDRLRSSQGDGAVRAMCDAIGDKLVRLKPGGNAGPDGHLACAAEMVPMLIATLYDGQPGIDWTGLAGGSKSLAHAVPGDDPAFSPRATDLLEQWLRFYGPLTAKDIAHRLGMDSARLSHLLAELVDEHLLVSGRLVHGQPQTQVCHAENFEALLHIARRRRTATIKPRDINELAPVLACFQKVVASADKAGDLMDCLQPLMGLNLPAGLWETEILPARCKDYDPHQLDYLMQTTPMMWIGGPGKQIAFCLEEDLDLIVDGAPQNNDPGEAEAEHDDVERLFADPRGRYPLSALLGDPPRSPQVVLDRLWAAVWTGRVTNDTMIALRRKISAKDDSHGISAALPAMGRGALRRFRRRRSGGGAGLSAGTMGNWRLVSPPAPPGDLVESEELVKDRVRLLLDRYGILFRQLLERESPLFRWPAVFRALRLMELSGEITAGYFFEGIPGPQFVSRAMLGLLSDMKGQDGVWWINALDPVSPCGLKIDALKGKLPRRAASTHLVYLERRLVMVSRRHGKLLHIDLPVDHPRIAGCFDLFDQLLARAVNPLRCITVETINDAPAADSPFLNLLRKRFDTTVEMRAISLYRRLSR